MYIYIHRSCLHWRTHPSIHARPTAQFQTETDATNNYTQDNGSCWLKPYTPYSLRNPDSLNPNLPSPKPNTLTLNLKKVATGLLDCISNIGYYECDFYGCCYWRRRRPAIRASSGRGALAPPRHRCPGLPQALGRKRRGFLSWAFVEKGVRFCIT